MVNYSNKIELLSPAKNLECGIAAINCGADAVYIGAPKFGARVNAGNSVEDIKSLVIYAHQYFAKVYVTINTILYDNELNDVEILINELHSIGVDAIIFQDMAILEMNLPPIQLFASTQTNNYSIDRIKFIDSLGVDRIILARELSIEQIKQIKAVTKTELEFFVFGALCVSLSGQCYLSESICGRSANRGECSQPCRMEYSLVDKNNNKILDNKNLLSLHDLNLENQIENLILAGISSFKIEGRLKDIGYLQNVTAYFRNKIDTVLSKLSIKKESSGYSKINFTPNLEKTFNRGFTEYYISKQKNKIASFNTPKSLGQLIGTVTSVLSDSIVIDTSEKIIPGDGLCFFYNDKLSGFSVERANDNKVFIDKSVKITKGSKIFRNYDKKFNDEISNSKTNRKIDIKFNINIDDKTFNCEVVDEDGIRLSKDYLFDNSFVNDKSKFSDILNKQFSKSGDSIFNVININLELNNPRFINIASINNIRREILSELLNERLNSYKPKLSNYQPNNIKYFKSNVNYKENVNNKTAEQFYYKHGVDNVKWGFETTKTTNVDLMTTKYCIRYELDDCLLKNTNKYPSPLFLINNNKTYELIFDCTNCTMKIKKVN